MSPKEFQEYCKNDVIATTEIMERFKSWRKEKRMRKLRILKKVGFVALIMITIAICVMVAMGLGAAIISNDILNSAIVNTSDTFFFIE